MAGGKYLDPAWREQLEQQRRQRRRMRQRKRLGLLVFLLGLDAAFVCMIAVGRMDGSFGAGLAAALSAYFGYQLKGA